MWPLDLGTIADELETGLIVFDSNVLLGCHWMPEEKRCADWLELLSEYRPRAWVPYQVILEYRKNWKFARQRYEKQLLGAIEASRRVRREVERQTWRNSRLLNIDETTTYNVVQLDRHASRANEEMFRNASWDLMHGEDAREIDEAIKVKVEEFIEDRIGFETPGWRLDRWAAESECRRGLELPPSWADHRKKIGERDGDYFIWKQILEHVCAPEYPGQAVVFVTDDKKPTGWMGQHDDGMPTGAHPHLVREMRDKAGVEFVVIGPHHLRQYETERIELAAGVDSGWVPESSDVPTPLPNFLFANVESEYLN